MSTVISTTSALETPSVNQPAEGENKGEQIEIFVQTTAGDIVLKFDPDTLIIDRDIEVTCVVAQLYRNLGLKPDITMELTQQDGTVGTYKMSAVKFPS